MIQVLGKKILKIPKKFDFAEFLFIVVWFVSLANYILILVYHCLSFANSNRNLDIFSFYTLVASRCIFLSWLHTIKNSYILIVILMLISLIFCRRTNWVTSASHFVMCQPLANWPSSSLKPRISKRWTLEAYQVWSELCVKIMLNFLKYIYMCGSSLIRVSLTFIVQCHIKFFTLITMSVIEIDIEIM